MDVQDSATGSPGSANPNQAIERSRRVRRVWVVSGAAMASLCLIAVVALAVLVRPPRPLTVVTLGADYAENLSVPHNAYGWSSLQAISALCGERRTSLWATEPCFRGPTEPIRFDNASHLDEAIDRMKGEAAVLVISLHGGADEQGAYLLDDGCSPDGPTSGRIRLTDLLERLGRLPASQSKLLVLESTAAPAKTAYGEAENGFPAALRALNGSIAAIPNLVVFSASDVGQRAWHEPVLGRTVFLSTLLESLRGAACDRNQDGRFSAEELVTHVISTVAARTSVTRERTQTPMLLPEGAEGIARAARMELNPAKRTYDFAAPPPPLVSTEEVTACWENVRHLKATLPCPERTATIPWRRYRRLAIRYEQLVFAGATESAQRVADRMADLESDLRRDALAGGRLGDPIQLADQEGPPELAALAGRAMARLAAAPEDSRLVTAEKVLASVDPQQRDALRRLLYDRIFQGVIADPTGGLKRFAALSRAVSTPGQPKPAEMQLLALLAEGLPNELDDPAWPDALRLVLRVRAQAEQVLSAGRPTDRSLTPALTPWLRSPMDAADAVRRRGEDLLFGGVDYLPRATRCLRTASDRYAALTASTAALQAAIQTRDTAFDLLPFYNDVAANRYAVHGDDPGPLERLVVQLESAWALAHRLGDRLIPPESSDSSPLAAVPEIAKETDELQSQLKAVRATLREWRSRLVQRTGAAFCNNRTAALSTPDLEAGERLQILRVCPPDADEAAVDQRGLGLCQITQSAWRTEGVLRRTRLAVAALGSRLQARANQEKSFDQLVQQLRSGSDSEGDAGDPIAVASEVMADLRQARLAIGSSIAAVAAANQVGDLGRADRARLAADGAAVRRLYRGTASSGHETVLKQAVMREQAAYYNWRGGRALADGWNESGGGVPYFQMTATAYARLAEHAVSGLEETQQLLRRAASPYQLSLDVAPQGDVVADRPTTLRFGFAGSSHHGHPVVSIDVAGGVVLETPRAGGRFVGSVGSIGEGRPVSTPELVIRAVRSTDSSPLREDHRTPYTEVRYDGWFRGHRVTAVTPIVIHRTPHIVSNDPPRPPAAGVAIVAPIDASTPRDGGVTLVVDASGSMGPVEGKTTFKYAEAVETVRALLNRITPGVQVSVWVFGHAIGPEKTADVAEAAVECVLEPTRWDPADPTLLERLSARLAYPRIEPWNESALARTLLTASRDLHGVSGYKTLIAITDGIDNRFANDTVANPRRRPLGEVLARELTGTGIALQVVGFKVSGEERAAARRQFGFLAEMSPPGRWWEATKREKLAETLDQILGESEASPLLNRGRDGVVRRVGEAFVTASLDSPSWPTEPSPPGLYSLPAEGSAGRQSTLLTGGDLLLLSRVRSPSGPLLRPISYSATRRPEKPAIETAGWRAALLNHRRLPDGSTSALISIERRPTDDLRSASLLQVERPSEVWIEGRTFEGEKRSIHWSPVYGYPAPCWDVVRIGNTSEAGPERLRVWWAPPEGSTATRVMRRGEAFQRPTDLVGKSLDIAGQPVVVSQLAVEQRDLPNAAGDLVTQSCLVIELDGGPPCRVRLEGCTPEGVQHQYYQDAKRAISIYWPLGPQQVQDQLQGLRLTSISDFKREAERLGLSASFADLPAASPGDLRPTPSVGWFDTPIN